MELSDDLKKYLIMQIINDLDHPVLKWFMPEEKFEVVANLNYTPMDSIISESLEKTLEPTEKLQWMKDEQNITFEPNPNMMMDGMAKLSKDFEILQIEIDNFRFELLKAFYFFAQFEVAFRLDKEDDKIFSQKDADELIKNLEKFEEEVKGMGMRLGRNLDFQGSPITKK
jgi:hypothetical protein